MAVARYYDASKNEAGATFPGVPLRDLEDDEFDALPDWLQASVDAAPFFRKTNPAPQPRAAKTEKEP